MHTRTYRQTTFQYNGDYSGSVQILQEEDGQPLEFSVPFDALREFIADYVRDIRIARLEDARTEELLGV